MVGELVGIRWWVVRVLWHSRVRVGEHMLEVWIVRIYWRQEDIRTDRSFW